MSTTLHLTYKRFVRRADSGLITNTQFLAAMDTVDGKLKTAPWVETDLLDAVHPVNSPSLGGFAGQAYDAYRQSGDAAPGTGRQCVYGGMALYRFSVPASASGTFINSLSLKVSGDKFLVGGLTIAAILSDSATPPTDWTLLRTGGVNATVDASSKFAASAVVAETATLVSQSQNRTDAITLDLSDETSYHPWLWVAVSLTTFASYRREYWVEGSGALVGAECAVTFAGEVTPDVQAKIELRNEFSDAVTPNYINSFGNYSCNVESVFELVYPSGTFAPLSEPGDYVMMRKLLAAREQQTISQATTWSTAYALDNGVYPKFGTAGGKVGCVYANTADPAHHDYRLHGLWVGRSTMAMEEKVDGLSFDTAIPALPAGQIIRIAMYAHEGPMPDAKSNNTRFKCNVLSMESACSPDLIYGSATTCKMGYVGSTESIQADRFFDTPPVDVSLVPLGYYDISGGGLDANTKIPFADVYQLPRAVTIFAAINVIGYTSDWVAAPLASTAVTFQPQNMHLHVV